MVLIGGKERHQSYVQADALRIEEKEIKTNSIHARKMGINGDKAPVERDGNFHCKGP
jgi:hypothetical protein